MKRSLFADTILYIENSKASTGKLLDLVTEFSKVARIKVAKITLPPENDLQIKVIPINIPGGFFFFWQILKTVVNSYENARKCNVLNSQNNLGGKKQKTKLEDSHFPISNLLQSNNNQYHVILAQGQA